MRKKLVIALQFIAVIASMAAGVGVYLRFNPEIFIEHKSEVIGQAELLANPKEYYGGKAAGGDIPRLTSAKELREVGLDERDLREEGFDGYQHVTVETEEIIKTDVYAQVLWLDDYYHLFVKPYSYYLDFRRIRPEVVKGPTIKAEAYQEYYLVRMPDSTYTVARLSPRYEQKIKKGEVTLPIGVAYTTSEEAYAYLEEICSVYGADPSYTLYMIDEEWGAENHFRFFLIRLGAAAIVYFALGAGLFLAVEKLSEWMEQGKIYREKK